MEITSSKATSAQRPQAAASSPTRDSSPPPSSKPAAQLNSAPARLPGPHNADPYSIVPNPPPGVQDNRGDSIFQKHKLTGTYVSKHGVEMPLPAWHSYKGTSTIVQGTADIEALEKLLAGTGYKPVRTGDGRGYVQVWFNDYLHTSDVPYQAMPLTVAVSREDRVIPLKNDMSAVVPLTDPSLTSYLVMLPVSNGAYGPLDYGREILGMDKFEADIKITNEKGKTSVVIKDGKGQTAVEANLATDKGALAGMGALFGLWRNIGTSQTIGLMRLGMSDASVDAKGATRAPELPGKPPMQLTYASKLNPKPVSFDRERDSFVAHRGTRIGDALTSMGFAPHAIGRDDNFRAVVVPGKVLEEQR